MKNINSNPNTFQHERRVQDKELVLKYIIKIVEKATHLNCSDLKEKYPEDKLFSIALKYVTTTKKAVCLAFDIPIENACRYKRALEKDGNLVQSIDEVICPITGRSAHLLSTNPKVFSKLLKSNTNQLNLFD